MGKIAALLAVAVLFIPLSGSRGFRRGQARAAPHGDERALARAGEARGSAAAAGSAGQSADDEEDPPRQAALLRHAAVEGQHDQLRHLPQPDDGLVGQGADEQGHRRPDGRPQGASGLQLRVHAAAVLGRPQPEPRGSGQGPDPEPDRDGQHAPGHDPHRQRHPRIRRGVQGGIRDDADHRRSGGAGDRRVRADDRDDRFAVRSLREGRRDGAHAASRRRGSRSSTARGAARAATGARTSRTAASTISACPTSTRPSPTSAATTITKNPADMGAFKTPTMRDVGLRPPYLHMGSEKTLEDVIVFYNKGGGLKDPNLDPHDDSARALEGGDRRARRVPRARDDEPQSRSRGRQTDSGIGIAAVRRR